MATVKDQAAGDDAAPAAGSAVYGTATAYEDAPSAIPTGFPGPAQDAPEPPKPSRPGYVTLATRPPVGDLIVPPLEGGGEAVTITREGTEVDEATAQRARQAASLAGFTLREL